MDLYKVGWDGQIVEENDGDSVRPVVEEVGNEDSTYTITNARVPASEATSIVGLEDIADAQAEETEGEAPVIM